MILLSEIIYKKQLKEHTFLHTDSFFAFFNELWYNVFINEWRYSLVTKESTIRLMKCKMLSYKAGFVKATAKGDVTAIDKWKEGYSAIKERIEELKED